MIQGEKRRRGWEQIDLWRLPSSSFPFHHCIVCRACVYTRTIYSGGGRGGDEEDIVVYVGRGREDERNGEPVS